MMKKNAESLASVQYADIADIVKMLNVKGGGSFMDNVNEAQKLVDLPDASGQRESRRRGRIESAYNAMTHVTFL